MGTTANRGYPYPASSDPPQGNAQIQALAEDVDADIAGLPIIQAKKSIIAAEQSRTNTAYGYLGTEDKVTGIVLPTDGLIVVQFQALWKASALAAGRAALFIGSNQLKARRQGNDAPVTVAAMSQVATDRYAPLASAGSYGLAGWATNADATSDVTTGQTIGQILNESGGDARIEYNGSSSAAFTHSIIGAATRIFAAAGSYDIGVQFKATSGSVTAKERRLWVYTIAFDS